ncbi:MAG: TIGR00153 family protein [Cocleimonas sp.]|nr:TIGR00153 family protein [Cocleimonas sp.]
MARGSYMAGLFGRSPISPLQEHMYCVYKSIQNLSILFEGVVEIDQEKISTAADALIKGEHQADLLKKALRHNLPKGLFMPIDRRDLLDVLLMQDQIANQGKSIARLITGRKMTLPAEMQVLFLKFVDKTIATVRRALDVINELDDLLESGFRGREVEHVEDMITELGAIETEVDRTQNKLKGILYELEDDLRPTDVMFTYRLIDWVGRVADDAEKVGSRLQLMLAR